jgi:hypothetical protein
MAIKNKDGSIYTFTKPAPEMEQQSFWGKAEKIIFHNKFGEKHFREELRLPEPPPMQREVKAIDFEKVEKQREDQIQIVKAIEESRHKPVHEDIVNVWCLPCLDYNENIDPLYDQSYAKIKYGEKFQFQARILDIQDLSIQFVTVKDVKLPNESVVYPVMKNRRWWRIKDSKEVKEFRVYLGMISDYQPAFV